MMKSAQTIIKGAPIERKGVRGVALFMRPGESIEDVLEQIALERIALDAPGTDGTATVEAKKTKAELSGEEKRFKSLVVRFSKAKSHICMWQYLVHADPDNVLRPRSPDRH